MTDDSDGARITPPTAAVGLHGNRSMTVPVDQIVVSSGRRPINDVKVSELQESIGAVGVLSPLVVTRREGQNGREVYQLVAGRHRLQAMKLLGIVDAPCTVLERGGALHVELAAIDENFIRNHPSPAEHALLTGRRREITRALAAEEGTLSQDATASRQAKRRAGQKTGPDAASVRDQANKTGESKDTIQRSIKCFETLGSAILESLIDTSLNKAAELDALTKLPEAVRDDLVNRAAAGEAVSASWALREEKRVAKEEPQHQAQVSDPKQAYDEFCNWAVKYGRLLNSNGLWGQFGEFGSALHKIAFPNFEEEASEQVNEHSKKRWFNLRKGSKTD